MFPTGVVTREIQVGPVFDLISGVPYAIRVMVAPTRTLVWGGTGDPVVAKLKTYSIPENVVGVVTLPVTDQEGYETGRGESISLEPGQHAFGYKISVFYLLNNSVVKTLPISVVVLPTGETSVDIDELISFTSGNSGTTISTPDTWSAQIAEAQAASAAAAAAAAAVAESIEELEGNIGLAVDEWFSDNSSTIVSPNILEEAITTHKNEAEPHKAYDLDIPSLSVLFENGLV